MSTLWMCGDPHGKFGHVLKAVKTTPLSERPAAVIFLGDLDPQEPLSRIFQRFLDTGIEPWFIHGNHECDDSDTWTKTLDCWERNLHARIETIGGMRIAGLGGVFRGDIWYPDHVAMCDPAPKHRSFDEYLDHLTALQPARLRNTTSTTLSVRKHSSSIFPAVVEELSCQQADVLVTHEAPRCHRHGFAVIDELARSMSVKALFHGHHHADMSYGNELGFDAYQVGLRGIRELSGGIIKIGDSQ